MAKPFETGTENEVPYVSRTRVGEECFVPLFQAPVAGRPDVVSLSPRWRTMDRVTDASNERETLTWDGFGAATRDLARDILASGFEPEVVVAIARGGLLPAGAIAYGLGAKNCGAINVEFYTGIGTVLDAPEVLPPELDMAYLDGRRVLLVDDVADSGRTRPRGAVAEGQGRRRALGHDLHEAVDHHPARLRLEGHRSLDQLPVVVPGNRARRGPRARTFGLSGCRSRRSSHLTPAAGSGASGSCRPRPAPCRGGSP